MLSKIINFRRGPQGASRLGLRTKSTISDQHRFRYLRYTTESMLIRLNTLLMLLLAPLAGITQNLVLNPSFSEVHNPERDFIGTGIDNTFYWKCVNTADYLHKREIKGHRQLA